MSAYRNFLRAVFDDEARESRGHDAIEVESSDGEAVPTPGSVATEVHGDGGVNVGAEEPTTRNAQSRNWVFTINNPDPPVWEFLTHLETISRRGVYQLERGEAGTEHIQGYVEFNGNKTLNGLKRLLNRVHWETRRGTRDQAYQYCRKEDTRVQPPHEWGDWEVGRGARTDWASFRKSIEEARTWDDLFKNDEIQPLLAKYGDYAREYWHITRKPTPIRIELYPWQIRMRDIATGLVDDRAVYWIWDPRGHTGKSTFVAWLSQQFRAILMPTKKEDALYLYMGETICIWDLPRDLQEHFSYGAVEAIKTGNFVSTKYRTVHKRFDHPHVFIFANWAPDMSKLSEDRWRVWLINPETLSF